MKLQRLTLPEGHRLAQLHRLSGRVLRRIEQFLGNEVTRPLVSPFYLPGLNGPKSTAHEYLSFSCLLCPSNEGS